MIVVARHLSNLNLMIYLSNSNCKYIGVDIYDKIWPNALGKGKTVEFSIFCLAQYGK